MGAKVGSEQYWRARAAEARAQAETLSTVAARDSLRAVADTYEQLAERAKIEAQDKATKAT